jgi:hypothetical protein
MFFPMERELFASSARNVRYYDVDASVSWVIHGGRPSWTSQVSRVEMYHVFCEDEDYELYGDVLVREEGHGT